MKYKIILIIALIFIAIGCSSNDTDKNKVQAEVNKKVYTCPMHPQIISDHPGICPICQMDLVLKSDDSSINKEQLENILSLSDGKIILANVATVKVKKENLSKEIKAVSYIDFAEQNKRTITARFGGRIEKLFITKTGDYIKQGSPLFEIYSPDLVQAQNEFLIALNSNQSALISSSEKKLLLMGITQQQIDEIRNTKETKLTFTYFSPYSGIVIEKKIQEGTYVNEGTSMFEIADLSTVWGISDLFSDDISNVKTGSNVSMRLQAYPGEIFSGKVELIYPVVNPQTRTIKVRSVFSNSNGKLKPNMYSEIYFTSNIGNGIVVPTDAVLMTGKRNIVWVEIDKGKFQMREVKLGNKINSNYQILYGLNEGESVASSGGYLIDSESQLKNGTSYEQHGHLNNTNKEQTNHENNNSKAVTKNSIIHEGIIDLVSIDKNKDGKVFQDPMDWNVISDVPGRCPLCNMKLKEVSLEEAKNNLIENGFQTK